MRPGRLTGWPYFVELAEEETPTEPAEAAPTLLPERDEPNRPVPEEGDEPNRPAPEEGVLQGQTPGEPAELMIKGSPLGFVKVCSRYQPTAKGGTVGSLTTEVQFTRLG